MIGFIFRRATSRVVRALTGEDREPVAAVSDSDFKLAERFLIFAAGASSMGVAVMVVITYIWRPVC